jgi:putative addiction module component (TIGR02574 family)
MRRSGLARTEGSDRRCMDLFSAPRNAKLILTVFANSRDPSGISVMNSNNPSVFDLSPSEKLQLVEDLWDDLAAIPDTVPVHDWQKEELARRKANLLKHPGSGLSWEEVQRRVHNRYGR